MLKLWRAKPENIFITQDGRVKILDFGLAKLRSADAHIRAKGSGSGGQADEGIRAPIAEEAPTLIESTQPGMLLGTAGCMSPEQVRGEEADHRSDIFAFGCIVYEMVAGRRAFRKETSAETMTAILKDEPSELSAEASTVRQAWSESFAGVWKSRLSGGFNRRAIWLSRLSQFRVRTLVPARGTRKRSLCDAVLLRERSPQQPPWRC
ncbi:MAG: hypothetical protein FJ403_02410 [Verrucomicrobia bacterium]|nr:hypothetical protein [Verrucomicrobiota bacterium]